MTAASRPFPLRLPRLPSAARMLVGLLSKMSWGRLRVTGPDGFSAEFGHSGLFAQIDIRDWSVCSSVMAGGDIAFGEAYMDGHWDTPDLVGLLTVVANNQHALENAFYGSAFRRVAMNLLHRLRANTRRGARRNIEAHYDLGNDFYSLWLDPTMTYSSALFGGVAAPASREAASLEPESLEPRPLEPKSLDWKSRDPKTLESAQRNKYRRVIRELALKPGDRVLEIGCGWGGFAEEALAIPDVGVTGLSLSPAQLDYARRRLGEGGVADRASLELRDYRDLRGERYDAVASIEMIEAVGERWWTEYFATLARSLKSSGRAVIQAITISEDRFERYRVSSDFIQRYIFPGGMLPTVEGIRDMAARAGLAIESQLHFGRDYARTLCCWLDRFDAAEVEIRRLVFDTRFIRMWRFYLAYCAAGFNAGSTDVGQYTLVRG